MGRRYIPAGVAFRRSHGHYCRFPCQSLFAVALLAATCSACTIGAFSPSATVPGRPILWKNRDTDDEHQAVLWTRGDRYAFVTVISVGDTGLAWAGVNEAGLAVLNSRTHDSGCTVDTYGNGRAMYLALGTCATVEQFERLLDSLAQSGSRMTANFAMFDSTGRTCIIETGATFHVCFEADDEPLGMLLRANYSLTGGARPRVGENRLRRAEELAVPARMQEGITIRFILGALARDLGQPKFDPYPLPFDRQVGNLPWGGLSIDSTICRAKTRSTLVIVGPRPGESPRAAMMWVLLGPPEVSIPVPLWVQAGPPPDLLAGPGKAPLCDVALGLRRQLLAWPEHDRVVSTHRLAAMRRCFDPIEEEILAQVERLEDAWGPAGPTGAQAGAVTKEAAARTLTAGQGYDPVPRPEAARPDPNDVPARHDSGVRVGGPEPAWAGLYSVTGRLVARLALRRGGPDVSYLPAGARRGTYILVRPGTGATERVRLTVLR